MASKYSTEKENAYYDDENQCDFSNGTWIRAPTADIRLTLKFNREDYPHGIPHHITTVLEFQFVCVIYKVDRSWHVTFICRNSSYCVVLCVLLFYAFFESSLV